MARIEWVKQKLENWSRWCLAPDSGGLGYPKKSTFVGLHVSGSRSDSVTPTQPIEAWETDQAVKSLQGCQSHLYLVLTLIYAKGYDRHKAAKMMARTERTVRQNLDDADMAIARWFEDKKAAQRTKK